MEMNGIVDALRRISGESQSAAFDAKEKKSGGSQELNGEKGHWVTTEEGHHLFISEETGEPVAGNSHLLDALKRLHGGYGGGLFPKSKLHRTIEALQERGVCKGVEMNGSKFRKLLHEHQQKVGLVTENLDAHALGIYDAKDDKIYLDPDHLDEHTALHEFSHPFLDKLRASKSEAERRFWQRGIELVRESGLSVPDDPLYKGLSDEDKAHEILADRMAEHGKGVIEDTNPDEVSDRMYEYGREFYRQMGKEFGIANIDPDDLSRMTLDDWVAAADAHLFGMKQEEMIGKELVDSPDYLGHDERGRLKFNTRSWDQATVAQNGTVYKSGRDVLKAALDEQVKKGELTADDAADIMNETEAVYRQCADLANATDEDGNPKYESFAKWCSAEVLLDPEGRPYYGVRIPNGDYMMNFDFSTVCKKRRPLDAIFAALIDRGVIKSDENGFVNLNPETIARMQKVISEEGLEVACALCFVDSKRYTIASDTYKFVAGWNGLVKKCLEDPKWWKNRMKGIDKKLASRKNLNFIERCARLINYAKIKAENPEEYARMVAEVRAKPASKRKEFDDHIEMVEATPDIIKPIDADRLLDGAHLKEFAAQNRPVYDLLKKNGGAHKAKDSFLDNPWFSDILRPFAHVQNPDGDQEMDRAAAYKVGGVRLQSFSDFVPSMTFDYMQMMAEMSAKKLPMHVYTKEPSFVKIFGKTGAKINMSLVPSGDGLKRNADGTMMTKLVTENGDEISEEAAKKYNGKGKLYRVPVYDISNETFPEDEAYKLRKDNPNVGTIMVGVSDDHIRAALSDPRIDMVIPYHKSGINPGVAKIRNIQKFADYSNFQHTIGPKGKALANDKYDFYGRLAELKDPRAVAADYVNYCQANGMTPKFAQFKDHPNYYKLLADFRLYKENGDGKTYAPQGDVKVTGESYKGVLPHIREALKKHEADQQHLSSALGTKEKPGAFYRKLVDAFFTGEEAHKRAQEEKAKAKGKWTVNELITGKKKAKKKTGDTPEGIVTGLDSLVSSLRKIGESC